jgi:hypothetical protein
MTQLASGTHLGAYEILSPLGAGWTGEVYRTRDTRLDRSLNTLSYAIQVAEAPDNAHRAGIVHRDGMRTCYNG